MTTNSKSSNSTQFDSGHGTFDHTKFMNSNFIKIMKRLLESKILELEDYEYWKKLMKDECSMQNICCFVRRRKSGDPSPIELDTDVQKIKKHFENHNSRLRDLLYLRDFARNSNDYHQVNRALSKEWIRLKQTSSLDDLLAYAMEIYVHK